MVIFFCQKQTFPQSVQIDPNVSYMIRKWCEALAFRVKIWKMIGPTARLKLRPKSDFLKEVSGTPAKTALGSTSPKKDLPITVVKSEIGLKVCWARAKN